MSGKKAQHVHFKTLYTSRLSSAKQQCISPKFACSKMETQTVNYLIFRLELNAAHTDYVEVEM